MALLSASNERPEWHIYARHMVKVLKPPSEKESFFSARPGGQAEKDSGRLVFYRHVKIRRRVSFVRWTRKAFPRVLRSVPHSSIIAQGRTRVGGLRQGRRKP